MNIFDAKVTWTDGVASIAMGGGRIGLDSAVAGLESVLVGIRPEHILISARGPGTAEVLYVEPMGAQTQLTVRAGDRELVVVCAGTKIPSPGQNIRIEVDPELVHVFDPSSGDRL